MANEATENTSNNDHTFYNVLPPERSSGPLVNAEPGAVTAGTSAVAIAPSKAEPGPKITSSLPSGLVQRFSGFATRRNLIIAGAVLLLLAIGSFLIYNWTQAPVTPPPVINEEPPPPIEEEDPIVEGQPEGVTTPVEWQLRYFGAEICATVTVCGDTSDPDRDGLTNTEEYTATTDPNNPDSSGGGLADGDKVHIFGGDPLKVKTKEGQYTDADYAKYGYDLTTDQPYTPQKLAEIKAKIKERGLHQPTVTTLGEEALRLYEFAGISLNQENPLEGFDQSANATLDRDTQRSTTIKKIGVTLVKYHADQQSYPKVTDFAAVVEAIKPYITVATNFTDPVNKGKYVYGYIVSSDGQDFTLTYYSETQNLLIKYPARDAQLEATKESANILDDQRKRDLDNLRFTLLLYSSHHVDVNSSQAYVFPPVDRYKTELVPTYISQIPTDPRTNQDYAYEVGEKFDNFTLRAVLDNPPAGTTGYLCNQDECRPY